MSELFVVGRPIHVEKNETPTKDEVEAYQTKYIDELMQCVLLLFGLAVYFADDTWVGDDI